MVMDASATSLYRVAQRLVQPLHSSPSTRPVTQWTSNQSPAVFSEIRE